MSFDTVIEQTEGGLAGPTRHPVQMLAEQDIAGQTSVHDDDRAAELGLAGAPIEGPTHFSQFDPLCVEAFGPAWFERGCISAHFQTMVVEGESVAARLSEVTPTAARIDAAKGDGTPVLTGTATLGPEHSTELDERRARLAEREVGDLHVIDRVAGEHVGVTHDSVTVTMRADSHNGPLYPFTLTQKLGAITERSGWYDGDSPWGGPIVPTEMLSVLAFQRGPGLPVRRPSVGLFIDLEVRFVEGPVFVGRRYDVAHRVVQVGQSRSVESWWTEATVTDAEAGIVAATVLLHQGVFKASYPDYPT
ncbi:MAG: hypothetical protein AAFP84_09940 [Actinomycetota bacterium]